MASVVLLNNGTSIPRLGLGVFQSQPGVVTERAVRDALACGYRHIDTAAIYGNESSVGAAIRNSGLSRSALFVTTKLWNSDQGGSTARAAFEKSQKKLGIDFIDLYLLHWPVPGKRLDSWRVLEEIVGEDQGKHLKAIGVSNFLRPHLEELITHTNIVPAVNQIELSPFNYAFRKDTIEFCQEHRIAIEAYSPLTKGLKLRDPVVVDIAHQHDKTSAQVLIRWALQHDFIVIPKSVKSERIVENCQVFDFALTPEEMDRLDGLDEQLATGWDPSGVP